MYRNPRRLVAPGVTRGRICARGACKGQSQQTKFVFFSKSEKKKHTLEISPDQRGVLRSHLGPHGSSVDRTRWGPMWKFHPRLLQPSSPVLKLSISELETLRMLDPKLLRALTR